MTVLENSIRINAPPEKVWSVLASLDALDRYDPGVKKSEIISSSREGPGSARRCDLVPGGCSSRTENCHSNCSSARCRCGVSSMTTR